MRRSPQTSLLLTAMLQRAQDDHYGLDLSKATGLASGTLYPILIRLEKLGWLESAWEDIDPKVEGRSPRRYYRFSGNGIRNAQDYLRDMQPVQAAEFAYA